MQMIWKKNKRSRPLPPRPSNLPFESESEPERQSPSASSSHPEVREIQEVSDQNLALSKRLQSEGNSLAEEGKYREALGKWEAAVALTPERAVLHEQKAQVLLEIGETWKALQAATRATEVQPSWPEAWVTLSRAQLNFGEPELSIQSSKKALELQPDCKDALVDMEIALHLIANKQQLKQAGSKVAEYRYTVGDSENRPSNPHEDLVKITGESAKPVENYSPESAEETLDTINYYKKSEESSIFQGEEGKINQTSPGSGINVEGKHSFGNQEKMALP